MAEKSSKEKAKQTLEDLKWKEGKRAPDKIDRCCDAIVDGNMVYVRDGGSVKIYSYDVTSDSWSQLPDCTHGSGSIAIINGFLTTIGGATFPATYYNELVSVTGEGSSRSWIEKFPPMPTKRKHTTALCTGGVLIVAGGMGDDGVLSTVEVMNTEDHQWSTAADLPEPLYNASATVCGDQIYMLGGADEKGDYTKSVYTCSVSDLLQSCVSNSDSLEAKLEKISLKDKASVWKKVTDLPVVRSTCESFHDRLLAIGGRVDAKKCTTAVYEYDSTTNSWEVVSHMTTGRYDCFTAVLSDDRLIVVGGVNTKVHNTDSVELASL